MKMSAPRYCRKHDTDSCESAIKIGSCAICDQSLFTIRLEGLAVCSGCSVKHNLCIVCGKELEFDNEAQ